MLQCGTSANLQHFYTHLKRLIWRDLLQSQFPVAQLWRNNHRPLQSAQKERFNNVTKKRCPTGYPTGGTSAGAAWLSLQTTASCDAFCSAHTSRRTHLAAHSHAKHCCAQGRRWLGATRSSKQAIGRIADLLHGHTRHDVSSSEFKGLQRHTSITGMAMRTESNLNG